MKLTFFFNRICFIMLMTSIFALVSCRYNRPLRHPILHTTKYLSNRLHEFSEKDTIYTLYFQRGFDRDIVKIYNLDTEITDTIHSNEWNMCHANFSLIYKGQEYFKFKFNNGITRKVKFYPEYRYIYIKYRFRILNIRYSTAPSISDQANLKNRAKQ